MNEKTQKILNDYDAFYAILFENVDLLSKRNCGFGVGGGWNGLIREAFAVLRESGLPNIRVVQIKEKFGGLRFYFDGGNEALYKRIGEIEERSYVTCDVCGGPGKTGGRGYICTRCDEHRDHFKDDTDRDVLWAKYEEMDGKLREMMDKRPEDPDAED